MHLFQIDRGNGVTASVRSELYGTVKYGIVAKEISLRDRTQRLILRQQEIRKNLFIQQ